MQENADETHTSSTVCQECGGNVYEDVIQIAAWSERGLVAIDGVSARICERCAEQFYDEETTSRIRKLMTSGFPMDQVVREIQVPVFSLEPAIANSLARDRKTKGV